MDGLDEFEKSLAAEKVAREEEERKQRHDKHRHRRRDDGDRDRDRHRHKDREADSDSHRRHRRHEGDDGHRHKRSRHSKDEEEDRHRHRHHSRHSHRDDKHLKHTDAKEDLPQPNDEKSPGQDNVDLSKASDTLVRDAWMTAPSAIAVEHIHRPDREPKPPAEEPKRVIHTRELNHSLGTEIEISSSQAPPPAERKINYTFGDDGSTWRMTKLKAVYTMAEESGQPVEDVAIERFGSLEEFDDAREEKNELERRKIYGQGYKERDKPTGELYSERRRKEAPRESEMDAQPEQGTVIPDDVVQAASVDRTALNRLRAQMMKAKLRRAPDAAKLEEEYNRAAAALASGPPSAPEAVILGAKDSRQLAGPRGEVKAVTTRRGRERGQVEDNNDMSIEDMVREERRTKGEAGGAGKRAAERIARDARFSDDLEYMDDNAAKLARRVHKSEVNLKSTAVHEVQRLGRALDRCPLCHHDDTGRPPLAPVVSLGTRAYLTLPTEPEVTPGGAVIVPLAHRASMLECDDDEWEEVRNFMKCLTRMYHDQGRDVVFYEDASGSGSGGGSDALRRQARHAAMVAAPIPYEQGATAPAFFREALLAAGDEWSQHAKVVDTSAMATSSGGASASGRGAGGGGSARTAFRRAFAREAPYFHAWFTLDGGLGRVVDDPATWPRGDLFAREIIAAIVGAEPHVARKQGRWTPADGQRVEGFEKGWRRFDWTRVLTES